MSYRSILTYVDDATASKTRLAAAITAARQFDAHLSVLALGYEANVPAYAYGAPAAGVMADLAAEAQAAASEHAATASETLAHETILSDVAAAICQYGDLDRTLADHAKFADLIVLSQPFGTDIPATRSEAFQGALFETDAAVLVCPDGADATAPKIAMIAWNGEREALRAARRALPYLESAEQVEIVVIGPPAHEREPGVGLALMLSRHGIKAEIVVVPASSNPVGAVLQRRAVELGAGLLVMGGYGHSRLRQYVFGGVTRDILTDGGIRVLVAH
ncbi:MAG: universal stress protein [Pseudomonadota bacterium]